MIHPFRTARRRAIVIASGTAVLVAVGGGTTAAFAASSDGTPSPSTSPAACRIHLRAELLGAMPKSLKTDLKTLRSEPKGEKRAAERKLIREKALSGAYGERTQRISHIVAGARKDGKSVWKSLPASLQTDLKALRATAPKSDARHTKAEQIEQKALAGDYGTTVQQHAKTVQARFQKACAAKTAK